MDNAKKDTILIGFLTRDLKGPIPVITNAFIEGLNYKYDYIPFYMDRKRQNIQSELNLTNIYYFIRQYVRWIISIVKYKPKIVHYPITSYWNLEKSLIFLTTAKILGVNNVIGHLHGGAFDTFWESLCGLRKSLAITQLKELDGLIVLSTYWKKYLLENMELKYINVVNNPISSVFEDAFEHNSRDYKNDKFLFLGSIGKRKGVYDIIKVVHENSVYVDIDVVGPEDRKGDHETILKLLTEHALSNVHILGSKYGAEKISAFKGAGIFLFPSHNENFPLVIIEAACAALPIITTPVGALPEFFNHMESIYYVQPSNLDELNKAIGYLVEYPDERKRLGEAARKVFEEKLAKENVLKQLDKTYETILASHDV